MKASTKKEVYQAVAEFKSRCIRAVDDEFRDGMGDEEYRDDRAYNEAIRDAVSVIRKLPVEAKNP